MRRTLGTRLGWATLAVASVVALALPGVGGAAATRQLEVGSRGPAVLRLQDELVRLTYLPPGAATGIFDVETADAVIAFQGWEGLARDGIVGPTTWAALGRAGPPTGWGALRRGLEIDLSRGVLLLIENGAVVRAIHVSTGTAGHPTPRGHFSVYRKDRLSWSVPFHAWMPYASYFDGGFAVHGFAVVPAYPASHGCVRVPMKDAPIVWRFATAGTQVWIR